MNTETQSSAAIQKTKAKPKNDYLRVQKETKKKILTAVTAINQKSFGKPITTDQYVSLGISLITEEHLEALKSQSITNQERLETRYRDYCAKNGKVTMDEFLGVLLTKSQI